MVNLECRIAKIGNLSFLLELEIVKQLPFSILSQSYCGYRPGQQEPPKRSFLACEFPRTLVYSLICTGLT